MKQQPQIQASGASETTCFFFLYPDFVCVGCRGRVMHNPKKGAQYEQKRKQYRGLLLNPIPVPREYRVRVRARARGGALPAHARSRKRARRALGNKCAEVARAYLNHKNWRSLGIPERTFQHALKKVKNYFSDR